MRTLVLNAGFEPLAVVSDRRAVVLVMRARATVLEVSADPLRSPGTQVDRPSVILLDRYVRPVVRRPGPVSRRAVLRRDAHRCAYCQAEADTIDHVVPRSRGGGSSWANLVACCRRCNHLKADRLLEELGWRLERTPREPAWSVRPGPWDGSSLPDDAWLAYLGGVAA